tara:strand:+ start:1810 stop:2421 length:612 start_codon:yes stop_codon:yes gene_type:complete
MHTVKFLLSGEFLMMQNGQLANPRNKYARRMKELMVEKKKKNSDTDAIQDKLSDVEWEGGLYFKEDIGPYLPAEMIRACLIQGAKLSKGGASVKRTCFVLVDAPLQYDGPRDMEGLREDHGFRDERMAVVSMRRVLKTRPVFRDWEAEVEISYIPEAVDPDDIIRYMTDAGLYIGIGTGRSLGFGRFEAIAQVDGKYSIQAAK